MIITCPCGKTNMVIRNSSNGVFLGCSGYQNIGDDKLLINSAKGSCGCTVPVWPKEPILEGEESTIKVTFNSSGKQGRQNNTVTLVTNAIPNTKVITIKGNVLVPEKQ